MPPDLFAHFRKLAAPQPLSSLLRRAGEHAHDHPAQAEALIAGGNKALVHGIIGTLLGAGGGAIAARPGDEDHGALRGALYGGASGAVLGGALGYHGGLHAPLDINRLNYLRGAGGALRGALAT